MVSSPTPHPCQQGCMKASLNSLKIKKDPMFIRLHASFVAFHYNEIFIQTYLKFAPLITLHPNPTKGECMVIIISNLLLIILNYNDLNKTKK